MIQQSLYHTFQRFRTLHSDRITALPILILMPHSACNCRCVMCDIWKDNKNLRQLNESDISPLMGSLKRFGTKQVLMSGGEALLNPNFFQLCSLLKKEKIHITLLSTGLVLKKNADKLAQWVDDIIVSLDGDEKLHDEIRNIDGAYGKMREGIQWLKHLLPSYPVTGRTVIHRLNFRNWHTIIESAKEIGLRRISFLPADVSSQAFNREITWSTERQSELVPDRTELDEMKSVIDQLLVTHKQDFDKGYIAESPGKILNIHTYYQAVHGLADFPYKKCNAPWVSTVIEADGSVRPCFFHPVIGNIRQDTLPQILNGKKGLKFRKDLDMDRDDTCRRCVCSLNLPALVNPAQSL